MAFKKKVNPFNKGVSYADFLKELKDISVKDYLKSICSESEINWIEIELENFKNNNKKSK